MPNLTAIQSRLQDDLRGVVEGEVYCDDVTLQLYSTDASLLQCRPLGVIYPRTSKDVAAVVRYAHEKKLSIHPRGSGTGTVGGCLGSGLILDFTRHLRRVLQADEETVLVEPGVIRERLNSILRTTKNRYFAPSTGHFPTCTLGSILASDCVGPRWLKHKFPHDYVKELEIVAPDGNIYNLRPESVIFSPDGQPVFGRSLNSSSYNKEGTYWRKVIDILRRGALAINTEQNAVSPDCAGYRLEGVFQNNIFDPSRLFVGSEGSLGIITKALVKTIPYSICTGSIIFLFDTLDKATRSLDFILNSDPILCDLLDRRIINMVRDWDKRFVPILPAETEVVLVVELGAETPSELTDQMTALVQRLRTDARLSFGSWSAFHPVEKELFRDLLRKAQGALYRIRPPYQVIPIFEDLQVPVKAIPEFFHTIQKILRQYGVTYSLSGHIGHGQVRIQPILEPSELNVPELILKITGTLLPVVISLGGTVASASGTGLLRSYTIPMRYPRLYPYFAEIKNLFDPDNLFNPGCIVSCSENKEESDLPIVPGWTKMLRPLAQSRLKSETIEDRSSLLRNRNQLEFQIRWEPDFIEEETLQCNGCGLCRIRTAETRMCPAFRINPDESASSRAKANVLRGILQRSIPLEALTRDDVLNIAEQCNFCHCCTQECPALVDIPKLVFSLKSAWVAAHGLSVSERFFANIDAFLEFISCMKGPLNYLLSYKSIRWLLSKMIGISPSRKIPRLANRSFLSIAGKKKPIKGTSRRQNRKVVLFLDTFANYFDVLLAEAAVRVLEHNEVDVLVPFRQRSSGHIAFSLGDIDLVERFIQKNTTIFNDYIRQGYDVLTIEPLSAVCIRSEYGYIRDDEETKMFAEHTEDICSYLYHLHQEGNLQLDFSPLSATMGYHAPCRTLALSGNSVMAATPAEELLYLIPGLNVKRLERGCCGMAGATGMQKNNLHQGVRLGRRLFMALRDSKIQYGTTECSVCRIQMEQGADKPTIHPLKILAYAYGLMPELQDLFNHKYCYNQKNR